MPDYVIRGSVKDSNGNAIKSLKVQAMDSDQEWFEDRNDDIIGSVWVNNDGSFEIPFDKGRFDDGWLEGNADIYLIIRNSSGEIIHSTDIRRGVKPHDTANLTFDITLGSLEKQMEPSQDPYAHNMDRMVASFRRLGEVTDVNLSETGRTLGLLTSAVNAWTRYTNEGVWNEIGYDGPQVPRYPWKERHLPHKLKWEKGKK